MQDLIMAWRNLPAQISPTLIEIGSFQLRYYSLMYLAAFACTYFLVMYRIKREGYPYTADQIQDYFVWAILGVILGGRLGYVFFYNLGYYLRHPPGDHLSLRIQQWTSFRGDQRDVLPRGRHRRSDRNRDLLPDAWD